MRCRGASIRRPLDHQAIRSRLAHADRLGRHQGADIKHNDNNAERVTAQIAPRGDDRARTTVRALESFAVARDRLWAELARKLQVSTTDLRALSTIGAPTDVTPKDLANELDLTSGSVTTLLDRLETKSYCERISHPQDRRSLLVRLTPSGEHALGWAHDHYRKALTAALAATPGLDLDVVVDFLTAADRSMDETSHAVRTATQP